MREHDEPWKAVRRDHQPVALRQRMSPRSSWRMLALAASLAAIFLSTWMLHLNSRLRELSSPQPNLAVLTLFPEGNPVRGTLDQEEKPLQAATPATLILASLEGSDTFPSYELSLEDEFGRTMWRLQGAKRGPDGAITLALPAGLAPGDYRILVVGDEKNLSERQESYRFSVRPREP